MAGVRLGFALSTCCLLGMPSVLPAASLAKNQAGNRGRWRFSVCVSRCRFGRVVWVWSKAVIHKLAVRVQNEGSAACKEVACIIIAARSRLHDRSDTYTKTGAALTPAAPEAGHSSRRHAAGAPQHIIILYFIAICRAPKASSA